MRKKLSVWLLAIMAAAWMFTGCGDKGEDDAASQTEEIGRTEQSMNAENDEKQENSTTDGNDEAEQTTDNNAPADEPTGDASDTSTSEFDELCVHVESIGDNIVVGSKILVENSADGSGTIMVSGGGEDMVLIPIHFEENASYVFNS